ncbi:MAG TPA: beta-ketoacyl synthase N-terminal-like domain-containing protein [Burkholderiales bacterium]|nr:beta-ketoacyl synthase N-terminal-like domain-containing protein [Burkholderiales bacterium]
MASFVRAAAVASALAPEVVPDLPLPPAGGDWMRRAESIARGVAAALQSKAGLPENEWRELPCLVGSSSHFIGAREAQPEATLGPPAEFAAQLARWFGASGPAMAVNTACTSGLTALGLARDLVESGACKHALVLGVELSNRLTSAGFAALGLLSPTRARPCDLARDGLVLGEAFGAVVVSGSGPWRIASVEIRVDPSGFAAPAPNEAIIAQVMEAGLSTAGWKEIDLLKLQAGGSLGGDLAEARAVRGTFGAPPPMVSLKGAIGHTLGASGPAELALLLDAIARGVIPPTCGFEHVDPELGLEPKPGDAAPVRRLLFNLAGFGGHVASLALEKS